MAITITPQINGQEVSSNITYCYIGEPLKVHITDNDPLVTKIFADITLVGTGDGSTNSINLKYIESDVNSLGFIIIDLMQVARQLHDFNTYKFQSVSDILGGLSTVISKNIYKIEFYTNQSATKTEINKLPIIGMREFNDFTPIVDHNTLLTELDTNSLSKNLFGYQLVKHTLKDISSVIDDNYFPTTQLISIINPESKTPCAGAIHWKSKKGSWMSWGMDLITESRKGSYQGNIDIGFFESTNILGNGNPFIPVDYSGTESSNSISLKSLSIGKVELEALSTIAGSQAVYYQRSPTSKLELMRITSSTAPINTSINGGDFSVSLRSIAKITQRAI